MSKRVTIYDIAEKLGVSTTTVYRALNDKPKVNPVTRKAVLELAEEMGFKANTLAKSLARKPIKLAVIGFTSFPEFHNQYIDGARKTAEELSDFKVSIDYFSYLGGNTDSQAANEYLSNLLTSIVKNEYDGVMVLAKWTKEFTLLKTKEIPVVTAVNDIEQGMRRFCVQYDGYTAGKIAAELLWWRLGDNSPVIIASGIPNADIHAETVEGFHEQIKTTPLDVINIYYHYDNEQLAYEKTNEALEKYPNVKGIYVNSYNSARVIQSIIEHGRANKVCIITSDINALLKQYLNDGVVSASIFQDQYTQGRLGLRYLYQSIYEGLTVQDSIRINPQIILKSNVNNFLKN